MSFYCAFYKSIRDIHVGNPAVWLGCVVMRVVVFWKSWQRICVWSVSSSERTSSRRNKGFFPENSSTYFQSNLINDNKSILFSPRESMYLVHCQMSSIWTEKSISSRCGPMVVRPTMRSRELYSESSWRKCSLFTSFSGCLSMSSILTGHGRSRVDSWALIVDSSSQVKNFLRSWIICTAYSARRVLHDERSDTTASLSRIDCITRFREVRAVR